MLGKSKGDGTNCVASPAVPEVSSISSGLSIVGKIVGHGALTIFGHVDGELHASTVVIAEGAQMEGEVIAEELTVGGHVKGTIHANRVKLTSSAVVEGDIFHRTLVIEENAGPTTRWLRIPLCRVTSSGLIFSRECQSTQTVASVRNSGTRQLGDVRRDPARPIVG